MEKSIGVPFVTEKRTYTVLEIQDILGISQPTAYSLIHKGHFRCVKVGRHLRISKPSFDKWLDGQESEDLNERN